MNRAAGGRIDAGNHTQQGRFARAVVAGDTKPIAFTKLQRDIAECVHHGHTRFTADAATGRGRRERALQRQRLGPENRVFDRHVLELQSRHSVKPNTPGDADSVDT